MLQQIVHAVFSWFQTVNIKPNLEGFFFFGCIGTTCQM